MATLNLSPNIEDPDGFYEELLAAHEGLSDEDSVAMNARLVLVLANLIGSREVLSEAIKVASMSMVERCGMAHDITDGSKPITD